MASSSVVVVLLLSLSLWWWCGVVVAEEEEEESWDDPTSEFPDDWSRIYPNTSTEPLFTVSTPEGYGNYDDLDEDQKPKVLFAQGKYIMFSFPNHRDCTAFKYYEKSELYNKLKLCTGSERLEWWWVYDWEPGKMHNLHIEDIGQNLIFQTDFESLPADAPNLVYVNVKSGAGWMELQARLDTEEQPNLVGVELLYKTKGDRFWWRAYVETVDYTGDYPYVRPAHYCPEFRVDGTLCLLVADGVLPMSDGSQFTQYDMRVTPFRIQPFNRSFGTSVVTTYKQMACDFLKEDCYPRMGAMSELASYEVADVAPTDGGAGGGGTTNATTPTATPPDLDMDTTLSPESWLDNATDPRPPLIFGYDDLWIIILALLIIIICCIIPFAFWLGTRAGYEDAARKWAELTSSAGNVNIPLGYVATEWEDATLPPS